MIFQSMNLYIPLKNSDARDNAFVVFFRELDMLDKIKITSAMRQSTFIFILNRKLFLTESATHEKSFLRSNHRLNIMIMKIPVNIFFLFQRAKNNK